MSDDQKALPEGERAPDREAERVADNWPDDEEEVPEKLRRSWMDDDEMVESCRPLAQRLVGDQSEQAEPLLPTFGSVFSPVGHLRGSRDKDPVTSDGPVDMSMGFSTESINKLRKIEEVDSLSSGSPVKFSTDSFRTPEKLTSTDYMDDKIWDDHMNEMNDEMEVEVENSTGLLADQIRFLFYELLEECPKKINNLSDVRLTTVTEQYCYNHNLPKMSFSELIDKNLLPNKFEDDLTKIQEENRERIKQYLESNDITDVQAFKRRKVSLPQRSCNFQSAQCFNKLEDFEVYENSFENQENLKTDDDSEVKDLEQLVITELKGASAQVFFKRNLVKSGKDMEASVEAQNIAEEILKKTTLTTADMEEALKSFTKSITLTYYFRENLIHLFIKRSALLFKMEKFIDSIRDINQALSFHLTGGISRSILLFKKVRCMAALNYLNEHEKKIFYYGDAQIIFNKAVKISKIEDNLDQSLIKKQHEKAREDLEKMKHNTFVKKITPKPIMEYEHVKLYESRKIDTFSKNIDVQYYDEKNKYLLSGRNFRPGEIIYVEKPELAWLDLNYSYMHCSYCYTKSWSCIPCINCSWCMFCSDECKEKAWEQFHNIECVVVSHAIKASNTFNYHDFLALRTLLIGIKEFGTVDKLKSKVLDLKNKKEDDKNKNKHQIDYTSSTFLNIYTLIESEQKIKNSSICIKNCEKILIILAKKTNLFHNKQFDNAAQLADDENIVFCGEIFLKLRQKIAMAAHILHNMASTCKKVFSDNQNCMRRGKCKGACLVPLSCYMKPSCYPNVKIFITNHMSMIIFALEPIKAGTKLYVSYEYTFLDQEKDERQELLRNYFNFDCECIACKNDWPTLNKMYMMPIKNTKLYFLEYAKADQMEIYDKLKSFMTPILFCHKGTKVSQKTVKKLSDAMMLVMWKGISMPAVVQGELMKCMNNVLDSLYSVMD